MSREGGQVRARHALAIVEAAYSLEGTDPQWLGRVLEVVRRDTDSGCGNYAFTCRVGDGDLQMGSYGDLALDGDFAQIVSELNRTIPPDFFEMLTRSAVLCGGFFEVAPRALRAHFGASEGPKRGIVDAFSLFAQDGEGHAINVSAPSRLRVESHPRVRSIWKRIGFHLASAMRLRRRVSESRAVRDALLAPSGTLEHAEGGLADDRSLRRVLETAVRDVERARTARGRSDPERAFELWQGLVAGEWSLVDHWESDGRRFVAAYRNRPETRDPRGLTPKERLVLRYASLGGSNKEIAFALGMSVGAASTALGQVMRKLRCHRRGDLLAFADPKHAIHLDLGGDTVGVLSVPQVARAEVMSRLSEAERDVARHIVSGRTNAEIARARGTSANTVANQIRSMFAKLGVSSRTELAKVVTRAE